MSVTEDPEIQSRSLWIGEIDYWIDEEFIEKRLHEYEINVKSVKVIRNRMKGVSLGYGFIEFFSTTQAQEALDKLNNKAILQDNKTFKLNWASDSQSKIACFGGLPTNEFTIYVGELNANINEEQLKQFFMKFYTSVIGTKIVVDPITKRSKGYGFVRFSDQEESKRAIVEMNGKELFGKFIKVK